MKRFLAPLLPAALFFITGCSTPGTSQENCSDSALPAPAARRRAVPMSAYKSHRAAVMKNHAASGNYDFAQNQARKMSYSTTLSISVPDLAAAVKKASEIAKKVNGYAVFSDNTSIHLKLPVGKAAEALQQMEALGTVTNRVVRAQDVTEQYLDVEVRLDNLRKLQKRLTELFKQAKKVEDALKIERELSRVTTELERYQAQMNNLTIRIQMVDVNINFSAISQIKVAPRAIVPVAWVGNLGIAIVNDRFKNCSENDDSPAAITLPDGFVTTTGTKKVLKAANAENTVLQLNKFINLKGGTPAYYRTLIIKQLQYAGFTGVKAETIQFDGGVKALMITSTRAGHTYNIAAAINDDGIICKDERVYVLEVYGKTDDMKKLDFVKLCRSIKL